MPVTIIQPSAIDTYINSASAGSNYGTQINLDIGELTGGVSINRGLIKFDLSSVPPDSLIQAAYFEIYMYGDFSNAVTVYNMYRLLRAWTELGATWNNYAAASPWQTAGGGGALDRESVVVGTWTMPGANPPFGWYGSFLDPISVQAMVSGAFTNNGWLVKGAAEADDMFQWRSRENATVAERPRLTITWTPGLGRLPAYIVDGLQGGITLKAGFEAFANRVWTRYTPSGGSLSRSVVSENLISQARFGIKEQPLSGGSAAATLANQIAAVFRNFADSPDQPDLILGPDVVIRDQLGNRVPPEEIRPNNWMWIENVFPPSGKYYSKLTEHPLALFIEEVQYSRRYGVQITSTRQSFASALVQKLAGRSGG